MDVVIVLYSRIERIKISEFYKDKFYLKLMDFKFYVSSKNLNFFIFFNPCLFFFLCIFLFVEFNGRNVQPC